MSNLMQLNFELEDVMSLIRDNEGVLTPELDKLLEVKQQEVINKIDNVGFAVVSRQKEIEALKIMEESVIARRKSLENDLARFKAWLSDCVRNFGSENVGKKTYTAKVLAGQVITIKDNTKEVLTYTEERVTDDFKDMVLTLRIPYKEFNKLNQARLKLFEKYKTKSKIEVNTENATRKDEGFGYEIKKSVTFLGLKKLETPEGK